MNAIQSVYSKLKQRSEISKDAPIGVFDSGVGGLSIAKEIIRHLPNEQILYFADTAHVPYGPRTDHEIRALTAKAIEWLYRRGCKMVVVACNTASAFSLDYLRDYYGSSFPIVGLVPALKPAVLQSQSKVVAVLATPATFRGQLMKDVIQNFAHPMGVKVLTVTSLELVPFVEAGQQNSLACLSVLEQCLNPIVEQNADFLVLGCTHYPFLSESIRSLYSDQLQLVDSGLAVAHQTARILIKHALLYEGIRINPIQIQCYASGDSDKRMQLKTIVENMIQANISWSLEQLEDY